MHRNRIQRVHTFLHHFSQRRWVQISSRDTYCMWHLAVRRASYPGFLWVFLFFPPPPPFIIRNHLKAEALSRQNNNKITSFCWKGYENEENRKVGMETPKPKFHINTTILPYPFVMPRRWAKGTKEVLYFVPLELAWQPSMVYIPHVACQRLPQPSRDSLQRLVVNVQENFWRTRAVMGQSVSYHVILWFALIGVWKCICARIFSLVLEITHLANRRNSTPVIIIFFSEYVSLLAIF